jgi:hypothetical protein
MDSPGREPRIWRPASTTHGGNQRQQPATASSGGNQRRRQRPATAIRECDEPLRGDIWLAWGVSPRIRAEE